MVVGYHGFEVGGPEVRGSMVDHRQDRCTRFLAELGEEVFVGWKPAQPANQFILKVNASHLAILERRPQNGLLGRQCPRSQCFEYFFTVLAHGVERICVLNPSHLFVEARCKWHVRQIVFFTYDGDRALKCSAVLDHPKTEHCESGVGTPTENVQALERLRTVLDYIDIARL